MGTFQGKCPQKSSASRNQPNKQEPDNTFIQKYLLNDVYPGIGKLIIKNEKLKSITKDYTIKYPPFVTGTYANVHKAVHHCSNQERAVKIIRRSQTNQNQQERSMNEFRVLQKLNHPNIIKIHEFYQNKFSFNLVSDLQTGGQLFDKMRKEGRFSEKQAAEIMKQILLAVNYCHNEKIIHGDLRPENILYESDKEEAILKIIGFGSSKEFVSIQKLDSNSETPYYLAPEVLNQAYDEKCDLWSCGVILYLLLSGYPPFEGKSKKEIKKKISKGVYTFDSREWEDVSMEAKDFITKLLQLDPNNRLSARESLSDPWIQKYSNHLKFDQPLMKKVFKNMYNFTGQQQLQNIFLKFIVNQLATKEDKVELIQAFLYLDGDQDGKLSIEELIAGYSKIMQVNEAQEQVNHIFQQVDNDNSGFIDYAQFVIAAIDRGQLLSTRNLQTTFLIFDKDKNGLISLDDFQNIVDGFSEDMWKQVFKEFNSHSKGQICFEEFFTMMKKIK
ncbi:unnamed protein product (macronuclear) [Paramecium tetraurelia]|uniref:Calcium-dependent protein kinase 1 n=1 Tax=Paramecium tetraurelia TaxID=5888 RepID=A0C3Q6_PARTE|nr:uncharacterized protein GSPATT00034902001 [Paramecium tetraurelia]CAK65423.1 unnamed protein product [Paramecium tetraurelia]|eukprot:XP_001432820.1 hypothetical protein (macronuclear) [Paramecium tetraurelia strain d4-2]